MGRVSNIDKSKLVAYNKETDISKCFVCGKQLAGYALGNIKRHYETIHKHKFDEVEQSASGNNASKRRSDSEIDMDKVPRIDKTKLVAYNKETNISKCLLCDRELRGYLCANIKRHYETIHNQHTFDEVDQSASGNHAPKRRKVSEVDMAKVPRIDKTKLVAYNKETNISTCLLCEKELKGYLLGNIKRHYETLHDHKFEVVHRDRLSNAHKNKLVAYNKETHTSMCLLCNKLLRGYASRNIKRHYETMHEYNFEEVKSTYNASAEEEFIDNSQVDQPTSSNNASIKEEIYSSDEDDQSTSSNNAAVKEEIYSSDEVDQPTSRNNTFRPQNSSQTIPILNKNDQHTSSNNAFKPQNSSQTVPILNKNDFLKCCIGLVTMSNIPFQIFDDHLYFKRLIEPYQSQFELNLNAGKIVENIHRFANNIKDMLKQNLTNKMFCLKLDLATRLGILVINIQYIKDFKIVINTIGILQINKRHTANVLRGEILNYLSEFDIELNQVYATISDNGANITSSQLRQQDSTNFENNEREISSEYEYNDYKEVRHHLSSILPVEECAAHTFQLAAHDFLKEIQSKLEECTKIVMVINRSGQNSTSLPSSPVDKIVRWNSTLEMMASLLNLRLHIDGNELALSPYCEIDWKFVENFVNVFTPMAECTKQFQSEQYIIGDFYRDWLVCEAKLKKMGDNGLAIKLLAYMRKRRDALLDNVAFLSGIYIDPRFNFLGSPYINDDQKHRAVEHILKTYEILSTLNGERGAANDTLEEKCIMPDDPYNILEEELSRIISCRSTTPSSANIRQKLENLSKGQRMAFSTNVLEYWKSMSNKERHLSRLAEVILAVPSSQVSTERAFSALDAIMRKQGEELHSDTFNNLLMVQLNNNLFDNVDL